MREQSRTARPLHLRDGLQIAGAELARLAREHPPAPGWQPVGLILAVLYIPPVRPAVGEVHGKWANFVQGHPGLTASSPELMRAAGRNLLQAADQLEAMGGEPEEVD